MGNAGRLTSIDPAQAFSAAVWFDVIPRSVARPQLPDTTLLHAGPPYGGAPPPPVMNSAVQALLFEQLAKDEPEALRLLSSGGVQLRPAQDYGIATPLAQVISASMGLVAVRQGAHVGFAAMLEGAPPALRFGSKDPACRERLRHLGGLVTEHLRPVLRATPLPLADIVREALAAGEDCHSRTAVANQALLRRLRARVGTALDTETCESLTALPAFVLPILMAAAVAAIHHHGSPIEALGGNGVDFGVRRRGALAWDRLPATPPTGQRFPGWEGCAALPAIGDSVVVDFCGLGGQADDLALRDALRDPGTGILDPARIAPADAAVAPALAPADAAAAAALAPAAAPALAPIFNLAILDAAGAAGLIGRGTYRPPAQLFRCAPGILGGF